MDKTKPTIYLLGTSHISPTSKNSVIEFIAQNNPEAIAVELDINRLKSMFSKKKRKFGWRDFRKLGIKKSLVILVGQYIQQKLGKRTGMMPGDEMKTSVLIGRKLKKPVFLIDQDIQITLNRLVKKFSAREKWRMFADIIKAFFGIGEKMQFNLAEVPSYKSINFLMKKLKKRYPSVYRILITERNTIIAKNLKTAAYHIQKGKILTVLGAGHVTGVKELLKDEFEVVVI